MLIYAYNEGAGFGNVIFAQFAAILFAILFDGTLINIANKSDIDEFKSKCIEIDDETFITIVNEKINNNIILIDTNSNYFLNGYYQHDVFYNIYKNQIIEYIKKYPNNILFTSHYSEPLKLIDIVKNDNAEVYDIAIHIRLDDFIGLNWVMNPNSIKEVIESLNITSETKTCLLLKPPKKDIEFKYISYLKNIIPNLVLEINQNIMIDYNIMRNAKILVCSCSTFSWVASFMANDNQILYFPNYLSRYVHETYKKPHNRVTYYDFETCTESELNYILQDVK
jgi:hypothetical protein